MNRRILLAVASVFLLIALVFLMMARSRREPPAPDLVEDAAPSAPAAAAPSASPAPAPRTVPRRRAAAAPEPEAPPPAVVEAPPPDSGTLNISADVPGAQVFIDRQFIGTAPVTAENVKLGGHQLNVSAEGFEGIVSTIDVEPGPRDIVVRFREVRLEASVDVVHKHRIGSCKGTLHATPQGLRFETTDKDDAFSAALLDLETFQVDYLDKNLAVKPRSGRRYNFTDAEGNADRLFVFHRDVERARERLRRGDRPAN